MRTERVDEMLLVNYLLGNLSEEEQAQVEDRAFADPEYLGALQAAEADLIDVYVRGELPQAERRRFERLFLTSPQRRSKVEFARALASATAESLKTAVPPRQPFWRTLAGLVAARSLAVQFAAGMAILVCVTGASWLAVENGRIRSRVAALEQQGRDLAVREDALKRQFGQEQDRNESLAAELRKQQSGGGASAPLLASLVLLPGLSRAQSSHAQLVLNHSAQLAHIEIQLEARDDYARFRAELRTRGGEEVLTQGNLPRRRAGTGYSVSVDVPASALVAGEYELALKGVAGGQSVQDIGYYYFSVQRP